MAPGARSQPNKLARTAMFVLTRSRCSQSAGKVPTCEAACQRRWACTNRGDLLCHQRPGPDRRPDRRQNGVRARRCAAAVWRAALCEGKLGGRASPHLATRRSCSVWVSQLVQTQAIHRSGRSKDLGTHEMAAWYPACIVEPVRSGGARRRAARSPRSHLPSRETHEAQQSNQ